MSSTIVKWWKRETARRGTSAALGKLAGVFWEFILDSSPQRRRQRYGDADFDWDHRVDTTGATVGARDRLVGLLHSPYQPTEPGLFHEMMAALKIDFAESIFIDVGSGKGRALLLAADYPFRRIIGIELLTELDRIARANIAKYHSESQRCFAIEAVCGDAGDFSFPSEAMVVYLFNPLPDAALATMLDNLEASWRKTPRSITVLYHNPVLEHLFHGRSPWRKVGGTHQYSIFAV